jgi:hypothetical protein
MLTRETGHRFVKHAHRGMGRVLQLEERAESLNRWGY